MLRHAAIGSAAPRDQAYGQYPASQCAHAGRNFGIAASAVRGVVTPAPGTWLAPVPDIRRRQRSDGADPVRGLTPPKDVAATVGDGVVRNVAPRRARPIGRHVSSGHQLKGGAAIAAEANGKHRLILRRKIEEDRGEAGRKRPDRRIDHRARQPKLEFAGIAAPGMRVDVIQIDAPGGAHTGEFARPATAVRVQGRSEEHTSELQSLMRISYAVFCLKKKNNWS